jgi:hypothetical protein
MVKVRRTSEAQRHEGALMVSRGLAWEAQRHEGALMVSRGLAWEAQPDEVFHERQGNSSGTEMGQQHESQENALY